MELRLQDIEASRQMELIANSKMTESNRRSEAEINRKYDAMAARQRRDSMQQINDAELQAQQEYEQAFFALKEHSQYNITKFELTQERDRLLAILKQKEEIRSMIENVDVGLLSDEEIDNMNLDLGQISVIIDTLWMKIKKINKDLAKNEKKKSIWDMLGFDLDDKQEAALNNALSIATDNVKAYAAAWEEAAQAAVDATTKIVDAAKERLDNEIEASKNGYANKAATAQKELELAKKNQEKALKEQQKAQKAQAAIETATQTVNLITATSEIWRAFAKYPPVAIAMTALMWGSFLAAKVKAAQVTKQKAETYGEGTVELLEGGSHASGNDIDLGTKKDGTRRRAEGGEYFAVVRKSMSQKYGTMIPDIIDSLNKGLFEQKYIRAYSGIDDQLVMNVQTTNVDLGDIGDNVRSLSKRSRIYSVPGGYVEEYKNVRRIVKQ